jgi:hypothetical protein
MCNCIGSELHFWFSYYGSMSFMDVPIIRRTDTLATRGGQRSRQTLVLQDGLPVLGIVLGMPVGRWHAEFTADTSAGREASRLLCHAIGVDGLSQLLSSNVVDAGCWYCKVGDLCMTLRVTNRRGA